MTDHREQIRPTRHRLHAAMGVSALSVAAILALLDLFVDFSAGISIPGPERRQPLTVLIRPGDAELASGLALEKEAAPVRSQDATVTSVNPVERRQPVMTRSSPVLPADSEPVKDWDAMAKAAARARIDDDFRSEQSRASIWQQTRSAMFEPGEFVAQEEAPVMSGVQFRPQVHVLGLGLTIGSCFIGIPLLGVPVEQRTVAINLFVCASDSG